MTERGQAETVGYALVFSAVVVTVALVTISGQAGLVELRDSQRTASVQAGVSTLANNIDDVVRGGAPSRATELELAGGTLSAGEPITVTVSARGSEEEVSKSVRPIVYRASNGARLVYVNGAIIIRGASGGTAMLRKPRLLLDSSRTIVPIVDTQPSGDNPSSIDGRSRVLVRTERGEDSAVTSINGNIRVTIESPRATAWKSYLETDVCPTADPVVSDDSVSCIRSTGRTAVVVTPITVSFN